MQKGTASEIVNTWVKGKCFLIFNLFISEMQYIVRFVVYNGIKAIKVAQRQWWGYGNILLYISYNLSI